MFAVIAIVFIYFAVEMNATDQTEEALEKLNRGYEESLATIDGDASRNRDDKNELKLIVYEQWKNSLIKYTKVCIKTIDFTTNVLDTADTSDDASGRSSGRPISSARSRKFFEQIKSLKQIIMDMGSRSHRALTELSHIAKLYEKLLHVNRSLSQENSTLKSQLDLERSKTAHYDAKADQILANVKEETVELRRFFSEYEKRLESTESNSLRVNEEMSQRLQTLERELELKDRQINDLSSSLQRHGRPSSASTPINSPESRRKVWRSTEAKSIYAAGKDAKPQLNDSYEISLTDVEASDCEKIRTLEDGARTMATLLKEKQHMLRDQKNIIMKLLQKLSQTEEARGTVDRLQTALNDMRAENAHLQEECEQLRLISEDRDKLKERLSMAIDEQKRHKTHLSQTAAAQSEQVQKLREDRQRLAQTNHILFSSVSTAYKELGKCISETVNAISG